MRRYSPAVGIACSPGIRSLLSAGPAMHRGMTSTARRGAASSTMGYPGPPIPPHHQHPGAMPGSYHEALEDYTDGLEDYSRRSTEGVVAARRRLVKIRESSVDIEESTRRDSFWSFAPVAVMLWLYIRDMADRSYSDYAHVCIREHTKDNTSVKFVKL